MISNDLRRAIEAYALQLRDSGELFRHVARGLLTPDAVAYYVTNLRILVEHTAPNLALARECAAKQGNDALAAHFAHKMTEEEGHERWAENDLSNLRRKFSVPASSPSSPAIDDLLVYLRGAIRQEPMTYLAYILFAEYLTVLVGPELLLLLERHCGIPRSSMTVVGRHVELDKGHVAEGLHEIDDLAADERYSLPMQDTLRQSMAYFDQFCTEICAIARRESRSHATA